MIQLIAALAVTTIWGAAGAIHPVQACALPADPFVVVRVSKLPVSSINNPWDDFIQSDTLPGTTDPLTDLPYERIEVFEDEQLHFIALWDLTKGGTVPDPLNSLSGDFKTVAALEMQKYSRQGEFLLPVSYYFDSKISGKVSFKLNEMISRGGREYEDPMSAVDIGGFVKDGEYKFNGGDGIYAWDDVDLLIDNAPFDQTFNSPRLPKTAAYNNGQVMSRPGGLNLEWRVVEAKYKPQGMWKLESYSSEYHMDVDNIGANVGSEENPAPNNPEVQNGDYAFTYSVPSDPLAYHVQVGSALLFRLENIVWTYKEELFEFVVVRDADGDPVMDANGNPVMEWKSTGDENTGEIAISGRLARTSSPATDQLKKEVRWGSILMAVKDRTPPVHVHWANNILKGTTGETLSESASDTGQARSFRIDVIDNNPFIGRGVGDSAIQGVAFDPSRIGLQFLYALQVYDFGPFQNGMLPVDLSVTPKFVWARAQAMGLEPTVTAYNQNGSSVSIGNNGQDADAVYSVLSYNVPISIFDEPMGWHFATSSSDWGNGRRLKVLPIAFDGTPAGQRPAASQLPAIAIDEGNDVSQDPEAARDLSDDSTIMDRNGQAIGVSAGAPVFNYPPEHPPSICPPDQLGRYGFVEVYDNDWPLVYLRVTDTKYDHKVLFGDSYAGDLRWQEARDGRRTNSNKGILGANQKPFSDLERDWFFTEIYGDSNTGFQTQLADLEASPPTFRPSEFAQSGSAGAMFGYWVDEDVPLIFEVFARDNIDSWNGGVPGAGYGITTGRLTSTPARDMDPSRPELNPPDTWRIHDIPTSGGDLSSPPWPQYIFRNPNQPAPNSGDCYVEVEVSDNAPPDGGGRHFRKLRVYFHVLDNQLKIQSLGENRVRERSGS